MGQVFGRLRGSLRAWNDVTAAGSCLVGSLIFVSFFLIGYQTTLGPYKIIALRDLTLGIDTTQVCCFVLMNK
jgi:hypothetical protein